MISARNFWGGRLSTLTAKGWLSSWPFFFGGG